MSDRAAPVVRPEAEEDWGAVSMKQTTRFDEECRRALALLAESPDGCTRAIMLAHGFSLALTASLIRGGLATDQMAKRVGSGTRPIAHLINPRNRGKVSRQGRGSRHARTARAGSEGGASRFRDFVHGTPPNRGRFAAVQN